MKSRFACLILAIAALSMPGIAGASPAPYALADGIFARAMTSGSDGNLWFVGYSHIINRSTVGKVTPNGEVTEFPLPGAFTLGGRAASIVSGPDGNLWFVEWGANAIGRVSTDGRTTSFPLPASGSRPTAITTGPDGNLWFTEGAGSRIGRITPDGEITEFPLAPGSRPSAITADPRGSLWFTERGSNRIGRITTAGHVTEFPLSGPPAKLNGIAAGPDGNFWFTGEAVSKVGRITPQGRVTQFPVPTEGTGKIVAGPEGRLWFASGNEVAAIDSSGEISWPACLTSNCDAGPAALAFGPEGDLWVSMGAESCSRCGGGSAIGLMMRPGRIGRYELPPVSLGIGPRAAPVVDGETRLTMACGLSGGCRGVLRLGFLERRRNGAKRFRVQAKGIYDLAQGEAGQVHMRVFRKTLEELEEATGASTTYVTAVAGPVGQTLAQRGGIALTLGGRGKR